MLQRFKFLFFLLTLLISFKLIYSQTLYVKLSTRLARVAYLIDGIKPHFDYYPPTQDERGRFVLEYKFKSAEPILSETEERAVMLIFEQIVIAYGFADSAKYFDTTFIRLVPSSGRSPYRSKWAFPLSTLKVNPTNEDDRFHALLNIVPFDHSEYFTTDTAYVNLYQIPNISPTRNLAEIFHNSYPSNTVLCIWPSAPLRLRVLF